jgi:hypothetical protein
MGAGLQVEQETAGEEGVEPGVHGHSIAEERGAGRRGLPQTG